MSFPTKILPDARLDIISTITWYNEQKAGLGKRFRDALTETIHAIREQPLLFAERYRGIRLAPLRKFPYLVYYFFDEPGHRVIIIAVLHGGRNPEVWKERV